MATSIPNIDRAVFVLIRLSDLLCGAEQPGESEQRVGHLFGLVSIAALAHFDRPFHPSSRLIEATFGQIKSSQAVGEANAVGIADAECFLADGEAQLQCLFRFGESVAGKVYYGQPLDSRQE